MSESTWYVMETVPAMTLREFAAREGLTVIVTERTRNVGDPSRYFARFRNGEIAENGCLVGTFGNGATPEAAPQEYAESISMRRLVVDAFKDTRREITVPRLSGAE